MTTLTTTRGLTTTTPPIPASTSRSTFLLTRLLAAFRLELRLIVRHWSFWLLTVLFGAYMGSFGSMPFVTSREMLLGGYARNATGIISLIALFLTAYGAGRARRNRFDSLEAAFPTGSEVVLGRWLAVSTASVVFLIVALLPPLAFGTFGSWLKAAPIFALETLLTILFTTALIWLVEATWGIRRWMFPILAALWMGSAMLPVFLTTREGLVIPGVNLTNFPRFGYGAYAELWGRLIQGDFPLLFNLFYVGLIVLVVGFIALRVARRRFPHRVTPAALFTPVIVGAVIAVGAAGLYTLRVARANAEVMARFEGFEITNTGAVLPSSAMMQGLTDWSTPDRLPYTVTAYDLDVDVLDAQLTAAMHITHRGTVMILNPDGIITEQTFPAPLDSLDFTLNPQFEVTAVTLANGESLTFARDERTLRVTPPVPLQPGESLAFTVSYSGALWDYSRRLGAPPEPDAFLVAEGVYLPFGSVWYPIPGRFLLAFSIHNYLPDQPASFDITLKNAGDLNFGSNLLSVETDDDDASARFVSEGATWAQIIGAAELVAHTDSALTTYMAADQVETFAPAIEQHIAPYADALTRLFPQFKMMNVLIMDTRNFSYLGNAPISAESIYLTAYGWDISYLDTDELRAYQTLPYPLVTSIFSTDQHPFIIFSQGNSTGAITDNVAYFLRAYAEGQGDPSQVRTLLDTPITSGGTVYYSSNYTPPGMAETYPLADALYTVYVEEGEDALRAALATLVTDFETLSALPLDQIAAEIG